jgi:hypothetical protein
VGYTAPADEQDAAIESAVAVVTGGHTIATSKGAVIAAVRNITTKPAKVAKPAKPRQELRAMPEDLAAAARDAARLPGVEVELTGCFYWAFGNTKAHAETLKAAGWRWAASKQAWYIRPADYQKKSRNHWEYKDICRKFGRQVVTIDEVAVAA